MIKRILCIYFIASSTFACEIKLFERYIKQAGKNGPSMIPFESSTCDEQTNSYVSSKILELSGKIPSSYIVDSINLPLTISPEKIEISGVDTLIENKFAQQGFPSQKVLSYHSSYPVAAIGLSNLDHVDLECNDCLNSSAKVFQIIIRRSSEKLRKFNVHTTIGHKALVFKTKSAIKPDNTPASFNSFETQEIFVSSPEDYFGVNDELSFYKVNTPLKPGSLLQKKHLSKISLAQTGREVEIFLNHDGFMLQTKGTALQNGTIDEFIRVKNADTKKTLQAKVIGENKVRIDL
jgi:flagella basal body P-ring formation protein FlgA